MSLGSKFSDEELIELWHQPASVNALSRECGMSASTLEAEWRRLKDIGSLPLIRRPVPNNSRRAEVPDGAPPLFYEDKLLERLIELYGAPLQKK